MSSGVLERLSPADRRTIGLMGGFVLLLHVAGWGLLVLAASTDSQSGASGALGIGLGVTAYTLGLRHAFDVDHIAAIDNTTRALLVEPDGTGRRPLSVGFWFSLGHSSIVLGLCLLLALGVRTLSAQVQDESSTLQQTAAVVGTSVSGVFLLTIGLINAAVLVGIIGVVRRMRSGAFDEQELEHQLERRGLMNRLLRGVTRRVTKPRHMYPVGALFGLGFDTATEVSLLVLASGAAALSLPWYSLLVLPILFAAGMSLLDTIDGVFMGYAYDWAFLRPVRKVYYNLVITGLSVAVALMIGGIEILGLFGWLTGIDLDHIGYAVFVLFGATWLMAAMVWRLGRIEERWS